LGLFGGERERIRDATNIVGSFVKHVLLNP